MWPEAIRAVREIRPKAFVLENVRGLFRPAFANYLNYITVQLTYPDIKLRSDEKWKEHLARLRQHEKTRSVLLNSRRYVSFGEFTFQDFEESASTLFVQLDCLALFPRHLSTIATVAVF
jgi:hypothetical protein